MFPFLSAASQDSRRPCSGLAFGCIDIACLHERGCGSPLWLSTDSLRATETRVGPARNRLTRRWPRASHFGRVYHNATRQRDETIRRGKRLSLNRSTRRLNKEQGRASRSPVDPSVAIRQGLFLGHSHLPNEDSARPQWPITMSQRQDKDSRSKLHQMF